MTKKPAQPSAAKKLGLQKRKFTQPSHFCRINAEYRPDQVSLSAEPWNRPDVTEGENESKMAS